MLFVCVIVVLSNWVTNPALVTVAMPPLDDARGCWRQRVPEPVKLAGLPIQIVVGPVIVGRIYVYAVTDDCAVHPLWEKTVTVWVVVTVGARPGSCWIEVNPPGDVQLKSAAGSLVSK